MDENRFEGAARDIGGNIKDTVANAGGLGTSVVDRLDDTSAYLGDAVAERPLTALLVAGAIGYVLATLIRR